MEEEEGMEDDMDDVVESLGERVCDDDRGMAVVCRPSLASLAFTAFLRDLRGAA